MEPAGDLQVTGLAQKTRLGGPDLNHIAADVSAVLSPVLDLARLAEDQPDLQELQTAPDHVHLEKVSAPHNLILRVAGTHIRTQAISCSVRTTLRPRRSSNTTSIMLMSRAPRPRLSENDASATTAFDASVSGSCTRHPLRLNLISRMIVVSVSTQARPANIVLPHIT
jgi:hypothetical protein